MRWARFTAVVFAAVLIVSCFLPWVTVESKNIVVSGVKAEGTNFGKPGYMHILLAVIYLLMAAVNKGWSKGVALGVCALNIGWAIRNFFLISACRMGECPIRHFGIYAILIFSIGMLIVIPFTATKRNQPAESEQNKTAG